VMVGNVTG